MANTLTISVSSDDLAYLKLNPLISASKIFRSSLRLHRALESFPALDMFDIIDFKFVVEKLQETNAILQKEIILRQERIESLRETLINYERNMKGGNKINVERNN